MGRGLDSPAVGAVLPAGSGGVFRGGFPLVRLLVSGPLLAAGVLCAAPRAVRVGSIATLAAGEVVAVVSAAGGGAGLATAALNAFLRGADGWVVRGFVGQAEHWKKLSDTANDVADNLS